MKLITSILMDMDFTFKANHYNMLAPVAFPPSRGIYGNIGLISPLYWLRPVMAEDSMSKTYIMFAGFRVHKLW